MGKFLAVLAFVGILGGGVGYHYGQGNAEKEFEGVRVTLITPTKKEIPIVLTVKKIAHEIQEHSYHLPKSDPCWCSKSKGQYVMCSHERSYCDEQAIRQCKGKLKADECFRGISFSEKLRTQ